MTAGVYSIYNTKTNMMYVGCSSQIEQRWERHAHMLEDGNHPNRLLQAAHKTHADAFAFITLEVCRPEDKYKREQVWIDRMIRFHDLYNLDLIVPKDLLNPVETPQETNHGTT